MPNNELDADYIANVKANDTLVSQVVATSGEGTLQDPATTLKVVGGKDKPDTGGTKPEPMAGGGGTEQEPGPMGGTEPTAPKRFTVTDPRINQGVPTGFDKLSDAVKVAGPEPLAKIEESVESNVANALAGALQTSQQKDAYENLINVLNIPVEHLAGLISKGDIRQTATPEEFGSTLLSGFDLEKMDPQRKALLTTAVGILGMAVVDPMNPILAGGKAAGQAAKAVGKAGKTVEGTLKKFNVEIPEGYALTEEGAAKIQDYVKDLDIANAGTTNRGLKIMRKKDADRDIQDIIDTHALLVSKTDTPGQSMSIEQAIKILKEERGSFPLSTGGGGGAKPPAQGFKRFSNFGPEEEKIWEGTRDQFDGFADKVTKQRRGPVLHDDDLIKLESESDLTMNAALDLPPGTALAPEHMLKVRNMLKREFSAMKRAKKVWDKSGDPEDFKTMLSAMGHTQGLLKVLLGLYAEPARDVRIMAGHLPKNTKVKAEAGQLITDNPSEFEKFKEREFRIADEWINQLYDFFVEMEKLAAKPDMPGPALRIPGRVMKEMGEAVDILQSEEELATFMKPMANPLFWDVWKEQFYNSLLTGLAPVKNLMSTPVIIGAEIGQRAIMAGIDAIGTGLIRVLSNPDARRSVYFREVGTMLNMAANLESFVTGIKLGWHAFTTGKPLMDPSATEHTFAEVSDTTLWLYTTGPAGWATSWMKNSWKRTLNKGIDLGSTLGGRMLLGGDTFFKTIAHQMQLRALALREAYSQVQAEGLRGIEAEIRVQDVKRDVLANSERYPDAHDRAKTFAQYVTLQEELGKAGEATAKWQKGFTLGDPDRGFPSGFPAGVAVMPFTSIMFNAAKMAGEYATIPSAAVGIPIPLQLLSPAIRAEIAAGGDRAVAALAKIGFSAALADTLWNLAGQGLIAGNGPRNPEAQDAWRKATGKIPRGWWDPINKEYRDVSGFEPFVSVTAAIADLNDMMSYIPPDEFGQHVHLFQSLVTSIVNNVGIKQWTQGIMGAINTATSGDFDSYGKFMNKFFAQMVPYGGALRQVTAGMDPAMHQYDGLLGQVQKNIPILSKSLPLDYDALGEIKLRQGGWWNPFAHAEPSANKDVWEALKAHDIVPQLPAHKIDGIQLDGWQYARYIELATEGLAEELRDSFLPGHEDMTDEEARLAVDNIVSSHHRDGKEAFLDEQEEVRDKIDDVHERKIEGERVKPSPYAPGQVSKDLYIGK